ncbi:hypothetical protein ACFV0G_11200, partial [Kitasatospora sp. NPDC059571]
GRAGGPPSAGRPAPARAGAGGVPAAAPALATGGGGAAPAWLSGGAAAGGRMSGLGPAPWQAGGAAAAWTAGVVLPGTLLVRWWLLRGRPVVVPVLVPMDTDRPAEDRPSAVQRLRAWLGYADPDPLDGAADRPDADAPGAVPGGARAGAYARVGAAVRRPAARVRRSLHTGVCRLAALRADLIGRAGRTGAAGPED